MLEPHAYTREPLPASPRDSVVTLRVQLIGTDSKTQTRPRFDRTQRYPRVLPGCQSEQDARDWRTVSLRDFTCVADEGDVSRQALAFARTDPALPSVEHLFAEPRLGELQLALDRHDDPSATLRISRQRPSVYQLWQRQSPLMAAGMAATICVLSALFVTLLAP